MVLFACKCFLHTFKIEKKKRNKLLYLTMDIITHIDVLAQCKKNEV